MALHDATRNAVLVLAALAAGTFPLATHAQETVPESAASTEATGSGALETEILVETFEAVESSDGTRTARFVQARRLDAGEEVHYTIRVRNPGKHPVREVVVTKRLPFGVSYVRGSAVGPACDIQVSADGGSTFAPPARQAGDLTHVRWILRRPLAPGATALLRFRATFR